MADEKEFINGLIFKAPNANAPSFVKGKISIKRLELIAWLQGKTEEWINGNVKESQAGKMYIEVDNWKPNSQQQPTPPQPQYREPNPVQDPNEQDDLPF